MALDVLTASRSRARLRSDAGPEAGTVLVLWTVALVGLMVLAGMAIDLGNIAQTKQHTSDAARNAVLSAVVDLAIPSGSTPPTATQREENAVADAESYMTGNYSGITAADFDNCPDPGTFPAKVTPSKDVVPNGVTCIGFFDFNSNPSIDGYVGMAVAVPPRTVEYTLGRAAGLTSQQVSSIAYSVLDQAASSYVLPFGLVAGTAPGLDCIKDKGGNGTCPGFTTGSGQFGTLHGPRYRIFPGFDNGTGQNAFLQTNVDLGIDHILNVYSSGTRICDYEGVAKNCDQYDWTSPPGYDSANAAVPSTGMTMTDLTPPLFTGGFTVNYTEGTTVQSCTLAVPRLAHPDYFSASSQCSADNPSGGPTRPYLQNTFGSSYDLNGVSIANYLTSYGKSLTDPAGTMCSSLIPGGNPPIDAQQGATYEWQNFDMCFSSALATLNSDGGPPPGDYVFASDILATPRFGEVPTLAGLGDGKTGEPIEGFMDVYLDLAIPQGSNQHKVGALLAWVFPNDWVTPSPSSGSGLSGYNGGPYTVNLCSYTTGSGVPGNCT